jgi:hypothetical protein
MLRSATINSKATLTARKGCHGFMVTKPKKLARVHTARKKREKMLLPAPPEALCNHSLVNQT